MSLGGVTTAFDLECLGKMTCAYSSSTRKLASGKPKACEYSNAAEACTNPTDVPALAKVKCSHESACDYSTFLVAPGTDFNPFKDSLDQRVGANIEVECDGATTCTAVSSSCVACSVDPVWSPRMPDVF